jgi:hypothetical protein
MMRPALAFLIAILPLCLAIAQSPATPPQPDAQSPVGHWIADHPAKDTLVLWWDFHSNGTVTLNAGGIADGVYKLNGTTLTLPPSAPGAAPGVFDIHFTDGKLYTTARGDHPSTLEFTRTGPQTNAESPIVGTWRLSSAPQDIEPGQEEMRSRMMNMVTVYAADRTYHARMPIKTYVGKWDSATHTYKLKDYPPLHYERRGADLLVALPPNGKETHLYHPDSISIP